MSKVDLDAVMARHEAAEENAPGLDAYITAARWGRSAADVPALVAELRAAWAFERFIREYAITPYVRALTLVENWDRLVAAGDAYPGSEESSQ